MLAELSAKIERAGLGNVGVLLADLAAGDPLPGGYDLVGRAMALHRPAQKAPGFPPGAFFMSVRGGATV